MKFMNDVFRFEIVWGFVRSISNYSRRERNSRRARPIRTRNSFGCGVKERI
eukprot:UN02034